VRRRITLLDGRIIKDEGAVNHPTLSRTTATS
jgi:hypothetical protein